MNRRSFTISCLRCGAVTAPFLAACQSTYYTQGMIGADSISVPRSEFTYLRKDKPMMREFIIVRNERLEYPIYVYRFSDNEYSAVLMKCTHQGTTLSAAGDHLHCSSHGSEFNNRGIREQGPAERNLRAFTVSADDEKIFIDLRT